MCDSYSCVYVSPCSATVLCRSVVQNIKYWPRSYSEDLRWRTLWVTVVRGMSVQEVASVLFMCEKSVHGYQSLFHSTGSIAPKRHTGGPNKTPSDFLQFMVLQTLIHHPTAYLHEVQDQATGSYLGER